MLTHLLSCFQIKTDLLIKGDHYDKASVAKIAANKKNTV